MPVKPISIRPFIGSKDFALSRQFYKELGFEETVLFYNMSLFTKEALSFYLQDAYVKEWIENTMIFLEVPSAVTYHEELQTLNLPEKYEMVRLSPVKEFSWGKECYLHDPAGILWHIGEFNQPKLS